MEDQPMQETPADDQMADEEEEVVEPDESDEDSQETPYEEPQTELVYEGECRVYDKHTTSDKGEVITSFRGLSVPMTRTDWQESGIVPRAGDKITVDRGGYSEYGYVIDVNPANFGGTHIVWRYGRN